MFLKEKMYFCEHHEYIVEFCRKPRYLKRRTWYARWMDFNSRSLIWCWVRVMDNIASSSPSPTLGIVTKEDYYGLKVFVTSSSGRKKSSLLLHLVDYFCLPGESNLILRTYSSLRFPVSFLYKMDSDFWHGS